MSNSITNIAVHLSISNDDKSKLISALNIVYMNDPRSVVKQGVSSIISRMTSKEGNTIIITDAEYDCAISGIKNVIDARSIDDMSDLIYVMSMLTR